MLANEGNTNLQYPYGSLMSLVWLKLTKINADINMLEMQCVRSVDCGSYVIIHCVFLK